MRKLSARLTMGIALILSSGFCAATFAGTAVLTWNANTDAVAGYNVYFGTTSHTYGTPVDVGNLTTYTVTSLNPGTYYFAVKAYNSGRTESGFSNEVAKLITVGTPSSHCDVNADTATNALDLQVVINAILVGTNLFNADINGDGKVDVLDLQILNNVILGARSCP
jgi:hypothetical protein